jgi:hypothetical protein
MHVMRDDVARVWCTLTTSTANQSPPSAAASTNHTPPDHATALKPAAGDGGDGCVGGNGGAGGGGRALLRLLRPSARSSTRAGFTAAAVEWSAELEAAVRALTSAHLLLPRGDIRVSALPNSLSSICVVVSGDCRLQCCCACATCAGGCS